MRAMTQTAYAGKFSLQPVHARRRDEIKTAIESIRSEIDALVIIDDGLFVANARHIAEIAATNKLPSVGFREYCEAGGLAAYAVDFPYIWRGAGAFVEKIFNGRKPAELPIQQATRFEFVINLRTAKTLDFEVSPLMSARANQIIE
jgi:putative ABC transport system substrate-binding protein